MARQYDLINPFAPARGTADAASAPATRSRRPSEFWPYLAALLLLGPTTAVAWLLRPIAGLENVDLVFLTAIIAIAVRYGLWPSLAGSVASLLAYNFFFIPPLYTFAVADPTNLAALFFFLVVAVITSHLAARARADAVAARDRALTTEALYAFSRRTADIATTDELAVAATEQIGSMLELDVVLLMPDDEQLLHPRAGFPAIGTIEPLDLEGIRQAFGCDAAGPRRDVLRLGSRLFMPLRAGERLVGVVGIAPAGHRREPRAPVLGEEEQRLLAALIDQAAVALERLHLARERDEARFAVETERLRSALLTSLSHDLKTPLASITGAITALRQYPDLYDRAARDELAATIQEEAERLARFVTNLLDMTRLESGAITLDRQPVDVGEVVGTALQRTTGVLGDRHVEVALDPALPMLALDATLFEQILVNLIDNAAKFTPHASTITIEARCDAHGPVIEIKDEGPGLPVGELERVFEKFYRAGTGDRRGKGTGLGLAICRGFVRALGGEISTTNRTDRPGAVFRLTFPQALIAAAREDIVP